MALVVVIPVCSDDEELCFVTQSLAHHFGGKHPFACLLVTAQDRPLANAERLVALLEKTYTGVSRLLIPDRGAKRPWPIPQNVMFTRVCQYLTGDLNGLYTSFLYMEPDVWPLRPNWLQDIYASHLASKKLHTGAVVGMPWDETLYPHLNGAAIYSSELLHTAPSIVLATETPWDIYAADYIAPEANDISATLQHHTFRSNTFSGTIDKLVYTQEYTKATRDPKYRDKITREEFKCEKVVDLTGFALLHGCKDFSLRDVLVPPLPMVLVPNFPAIRPIVEDQTFDPLPEMLAAEVEEEPLLSGISTIPPVDETPEEVHTAPTPIKKRRARRK